MSHYKTSPGERGWGEGETVNGLETESVLALNRYQGIALCRRWLLNKQALKERKQGILVDQAFAHPRLSGDLHRDRLFFS